VNQPAQHQSDKRSTDGGVDPNKKDSDMSATK
jgi:hypothetical protein